MLLLLINLFYAQSNVKNEYPSSFWLSLSAKEKISFVNGAYSALSVLKNEHKKEVAKQYLHDKNWIEPILY